MNNKTRGFEVISCLKHAGIPLPVRKTKNSAGYDISVIHPAVFELLKQGISLKEAWKQVCTKHEKTDFAIVWKEKEGQKAILLPTGLKAYMMSDEVLLMAIRSSKGIKNGIIQANPPSIIDADYYNNPDNEGHIYFAISNPSIVFDKPIMPIAQGLFTKYLTIDNDIAENERVGGIGSTDGFTAH